MRCSAPWADSSWSRGIPAGCSRPTARSPTTALATSSIRSTNAGVSTICGSHASARSVARLTTRAGNLVVLEDRHRFAQLREVLVAVQQQVLSVDGLRVTIDGAIDEVEDVRLLALLALLVLLAEREQLLGADAVLSREFLDRRLLAVLLVVVAVLVLVAAA